jgi:putative FmdB family regulatory protein
LLFRYNRYLFRCWEGIVPIYEYRCATCGFQKEYLQKVSDPLLSICPECGKATFGKMLTSAGFQLKGGGWYATDFKNSGARPAAKLDDQSGTAAKAESKTEGKTEGKTETTGEGKGASKTEAQPAAAAVTPAATAKAE